MSEDKRQLNVRLSPKLIARLKRVKERHALRPSWDALIETLVTGEKKLSDLESETEARKK